MTRAEMDYLLYAHNLENHSEILRIHLCICKNSISIKRRKRNYFACILYIQIFQLYMINQSSSSPAVSSFFLLSKYNIQYTEYQSNCNTIPIGVLTNASKRNIKEIKTKDWSLLPLMISVACGVQSVVNKF